MAGSLADVPSLCVPLKLSRLSGPNPLRREICDSSRDHLCSSVAGREYEQPSRSCKAQPGMALVSRIRGRICAYEVNRLPVTLEMLLRRPSE
jgi:hypothetical protein